MRRFFGHFRPYSLFKILILALLINLTVALSMPALCAAEDESYSYNGFKLDYEEGVSSAEDVAKVARIYGPAHNAARIPTVDLAEKPPIAKPVQIGGKVAIIIDDMGLDVKRSKQVVDFDVPLTLAYLPYAESLLSQTKGAHAAGHELMIHMPMEPINPKLNIGTIGIKAAMSPDNVDNELSKAFAAFPGYVGVNNHMGSLVTQDKKLMAQVMKRLKNKGLYFIDSRTIKTSVAARMAKTYGLKTAVRDVFLDHVESDAFVDEAFEKVLQALKRKGTAIVIGHPKSVTIRGMQRWIPKLQAMGVEFVHASELVKIYKKPTPSADEELIMAEMAVKVAQIEPTAGENHDHMHDKASGIYHSVAPMSKSADILGALVSTSWIPQSLALPRE